jgi:hypothetical protein
MWSRSEAPNAGPICGAHNCILTAGSKRLWGHDSCMIGLSPLGFRNLWCAVLLCLSAAVCDGQTQTRFAEACKAGREEAILAVGLENAALALRESALYLDLEFGPRLLARFVRAAPDEAVDVLSAGSMAARQARASLLAGEPDLQFLARLSQDGAADPPTRRRVALFAAGISKGVMSLPGAIKLAGDMPRYFSALADARSSAGPGETGALDRALENEARVLCRAAAESAGRVLPRELAAFRTQDLYLLLAFGRAEAEGPVFAAVFDRLLLPRWKTERPAARSLHVLLERTNDWALRDFAAAAAAAHRFDAFAQATGAAALGRVAAGIDRAGDPRREAIRVAEIIAATSNRSFTESLAGVVAAEFKRCADAGNAQGRLLYGLLAARLSQTAAATTAVREAGAPYLPYLVSADTLDVSALFGGNNAQVQRYFFYDDEDGVDSFASFRNGYLRDPDWKFEDFGEYVRVSARTAAGRAVEIYANKPVDAHLPANRGREFEAERRQLAIDAVLAAQEAKATVFVHRGHSFYVSRTVRHIQDSARLVVLGSCGGVTDIAAVIGASHQAQVIATRGVGAAEINDPLLKSLNDRLLRTEKPLDWSAFWEEQKGRLGGRLFQDYLPPNREPSAVFLRAYYLLLDR